MKVSILSIKKTSQMSPGRFCNTLTIDSTATKQALLGQKATCFDQVINRLGMAKRAD
ncbi:hypothetical protein SAMD00020551_4028 [Mesobacillus selenatarsenatis SF-1]|uniref:Uncharacterized protein n=1 Tax=Mesobacillus selenatarsenatis (strain DSM 18680 / JCM 14380 / FERM P-15431 / SF-1) TaxID=1321606 RepID=A0A0A8X7H0_MESS1|nr:hypothetical protein SAMD00020551_4028 [Mesobacillus selenatarsenatis SF-1]